MFCPICGLQRGQGDKFCGQCGFDFGTVETVLEPKGGESAISAQSENEVGVAVTTAATERPVPAPHKVSAQVMPAPNVPEQAVPEGNPLAVDVAEPEETVDATDAANQTPNAVADTPSAPSIPEAAQEPTVAQDEVSVQAQVDVPEEKRSAVTDSAEPNADATVATHLKELDAAVSTPVSADNPDIAAEVPALGQDLTEAVNAPGQTDAPIIEPPAHIAAPAPDLSNAPAEAATSPAAPAYQAAAREFQFQFCPSCGLRQEEDNRFCPRCGHRFPENASTASATPAQSQVVAPVAQPKGGRFAPGTGNAATGNAAGSSAVQSGYSSATTASPDAQGGAAGPDQGKGFQIAALVLGVIGLVVAWFSTVFAFVGLIIGIVAIACAAHGMKLAGNQPHGMAIAGLVCGILAIVFGFGNALCWGALVGCTAASTIG